MNENTMAGEENSKVYSIMAPNLSTSADKQITIDIIEEEEETPSKSSDSDEDDGGELYLNDYDKLGSQHSSGSRWNSMLRRHTGSTTTNNDDCESISQTSTDQASQLSSLLQNTLMTAASLPFGIYATEAWVYDDEDSLLINIGDGLQVHRSPQGADEKALEALDKIRDPSNPEYIPPTPTSPGVGLAGVLWSESSRGDAENDVVVWRDVCAIASDPDQPHDERLQLASQAGFRLVTGIPFNVRGTKGLVIYYCNPHADKRKLVNRPNERFMCSQADLIGSIFAAYDPTLDVIDLKQAINAQNWRYMKLRLLAIARFGGSLSSVRSNRYNQGNKKNDGRPSFEQKRSATGILLEKSIRIWNTVKEKAYDKKNRFSHKYVAWSNKCRGGTVKISPPMPMREVMWTFIGVALTHLIVSRLHQFIREESKGQYTLVLAPIGSITALQYALTPAPSAQPRNIILGQTLAITIGLLLTYIPNSMDDWIRFTLAPALAIPAMAMLGIPHPPAGATAIVFSSGELDWIDMCIFVTALCLSILMAVAINNLSDMRQYPTNWVLCNALKQMWNEKWKSSWTKHIRNLSFTRGSDDDNDELEISSSHESNTALQWVYTSGGKGSNGSSRRLSTAGSFRVDKKKETKKSITRRHSSSDFSKFVVDKTSITGIRLVDDSDDDDDDNDDDDGNKIAIPKFPPRPSRGLKRAPTL